MAKHDLEQNRATLLTIRDRLQSEIHTNAAMIDEKFQPPGDVVDLPTHNADRAVEGLDTELATGAIQKETLVAVEAALDRIDDGSYGLCESCARPIAEERLEALPYTPFCIECERRHEGE